jgi:hypothetical protein
VLLFWKLMGHACSLAEMSGAMLQQEQDWCSVVPPNMRLSAILVAVNAGPSGVSPYADKGQCFDIGPA